MNTTSTDEQTGRQGPAPPSFPAANGGEVKALPAPPEEVDVWWGSYASRTMWPSFLVCLLATGGIAWLTWAALPAQLVKLEFVGLSGAIWLVQGVRWSYRFFGFNYRMTTRRLFRHRGFRYFPSDQVELARVAQVLVKCSWQERLVGVGQVLVQAEDLARPPLVLEGIWEPTQVAEEIRVQVQRARAAEEVQTRAAP